MSLQVEIYSPTQILHRGEALEIVAPSSMGEVNLLPSHTQYITSLEPGLLKVVEKPGAKEFHITGGFCQIASDKITVLIDGIQEN